MTRGYKKKVIIFLIFAIVFFVVGGIYLGSQIELRNEYFALKEGKTALAQASRLNSEQGSSVYGYVFTHEGKSYYSTTLMSYSAEQMQSLCSKTNGKLPIKYTLKNGKVVLASENKSQGGLPIAKSCEENYFSNSRAPSINASMVIFCIAGAFSALVLYNIARIMWVKGIEKNGVFAYASFVEAYPSRFGSNRFMAVRYGYMNENEEWVEAVSPYAYSPSSVELLKNLDAIGIKYRGKSSVIVETLKSGL